MDKEGFRFCRKCLTRDIYDRDEYFKVLKEMIDNIPGELKASPDLYEERLKKCTECERLIDGMCKGCGCYVELRAAKEKEHCPYERW